MTDILMIIKEIALAFTYLDVQAGRMNILGAFWFFALTMFTFRRFRIYYKEGKIFQNRSSKLRRFFSYVIVFAISGFSIFLIQMLFDDALTTPMNLLFGSWTLVQAQAGPFTIWKLIESKWDVYIMISLIVVYFATQDFWKWFQFSKWSLLWLSIIIAYQIALSYFHIFQFRGLPEDIRIRNYWITYPEWRTLTGLFVTTIIRKPKEIIP